MIVCMPTHQRAPVFHMQAASLSPAIATDWEVRLALVVAVVLRGVGRGLDCVGERMGFTGETATERGTGDMAHGVGVVGVLPPPDFFCRKEKRRIPTSVMGSKQPPASQTRHNSNTHCNKELFMAHNYSSFHQPCKLAE